jgi:hypothetical protein
MKGLIGLNGLRSIIYKFELDEKIMVMQTSAAK